MFSMAISATSQENTQNLNFANLIATSQGEIYLGSLEDWDDLQNRMKKSDTDINFSTKKEPGIEQAFFVTRLKVNATFKKKYKVDFIDVAIPSAKANGVWRPLCDIKSLRNESFFLIDKMTIGGTTINAVVLSVPHSDKFEKSLKENLKLTGEGKKGR